MSYIDIVFDGPPSHESGRFVEVENASGASIKFGDWVHRPDGYWALRIPATADHSRKAEQDACHHEWNHGGSIPRCNKCELKYDFWLKQQKR